MKLFFDQNNRKNSVGRKLILLIIIVSSFITLISTAFQLIIDHRRDVNSIHLAIEEIRNTQVGTLGHLIWNYDKDTIRIMLDGLLEVEGIEYLKLSSDQNNLWEAGEVRSKRIISQTFPINYTALNKTGLGELHIVAGLDPIYQRLLHRALIILLSNAIKTFIVAFLALMAFQILVTRHMFHMAFYLEQIGRGGHEHKLVLERKQNASKSPDELDHMVLAINSMRLAQKKAFGDLQKAEERYRMLVEQTDDLITRADDQGRFTFINSSSERVFGIKPEACIGLSAFDFVHPDDRERTQESFTGWVSQKQKRVTFQNRQVNQKSQQVFDMLWTINLNYDDSGALINVGSIARDITELKRAENKIQSQKYFMEQAQNLGKMGSWSLDIDKNELIWTDENYRIFGIPIGATLTYEKFLSCVHPDDRGYVDQKWAAAMNGEPYDIDHRLLMNDGSVKWVREKADLVFNENSKCIRGVGFTQDITERKRAEMKAAEQLAELTRWHDALVGREERVIEIKQEVNELLARLGQPPRYAGIQGKGPEL